MKRILLGADGSEHSKRAAKYAVDLAKAFGSTVIIATAYQGETIVTDDPSQQYQVKGVKWRAQHRQSWYKELMDKNNIPREAVVLDGPSAEALAAAAEREHADIMIIGSRGRSNLAGLIIGSTAHALLHIAPCPVIAVRLKHKLPSEE
jgi:nucleotide-binding universal stress UspA family protein